MVYKYFSNENLFKRQIILPQRHQKQIFLPSPSTTHTLKLKKWYAHNKCLDVALFMD